MQEIFTQFAKFFSVSAVRTSMSLHTTQLLTYVSFQVINVLLSDGKVLIFSSMIQLNNIMYPLAGFMHTELYEVQTAIFSPASN